MNTVPNSPSPAHDPASGHGVTGMGDPSAKRRWRNRAIAAATGTVLLGAAVFGATAASAANPGPSPAGTALAGTPSSAGSVTTASTSTSTSTASPGAANGTAKHPGLRPFGQVLRQELRIDIQAKSGFGDNAHEAAYLLIHHKTGFGKLPANLQADLKTLEGAAAADRDGDAG
ncbi:MAG TPA: hypothetical protein VGN49_11145, partial [Micrococcaceae bacterium]|nr:hypothetical protein [Micrococcaceae bacterium]